MRVQIDRDSATCRNSLSRFRDLGVLKVHYPVLVKKHARWRHRLRDSIVWLRKEIFSFSQEHSDRPSSRSEPRALGRIQDRSRTRRSPWLPSLLHLALLLSSCKTLIFLADLFLSFSSLCSSPSPSASTLSSASSPAPWPPAPLATSSFQASLAAARPCSPPCVRESPAT
ncbi:hypothetical protein BJY00DRAFT_11788 [Aspergillus carlsbadensis]|nr:hypothetical protein BJY00DRAFT_11788 [Aspergillus carlsbadensis]